MNDENEPLARWSQHKAAPEPAAASEAPVLPSLDTLDAQSDYTVFLANNVPEAVRRAALRKLWTSDPVLANLDGLNDYDEDYTRVDQVISEAQDAAVALDAASGDATAGDGNAPEED